MNDVRFVDTTVRDGQQSLWALAMRTAMILPIAERLDDAGFDAIEISAAGHEKKLIRELHEDPFERLRLVRERVRKTPLRFIRGRSLATFQVTPRSVEELWYQRLAAYGIAQVRVSDCSNTVGSWAVQVADARKVGIDAIVNLIFSISPRHTDAYYADKAREAARLQPFRICLKDPGALLTPERLRTLLPKVLAEVGAVEVEFHTHCNTGLGALCALEAIALGVRCINTAIPPLAEASSNPSLFNVARNARALGYRTRIDEASLQAVEEHFRAIAMREGLPMGAPAAYDALHYLHQVPGGMISNLRFQLASMGIGDRLEQVLEEIPRVRADLGYPIMVTPYSQFTGVQAVMNVVTGVRYQEVADEIIQYALGLWGADEASSMDPDVRDRVLDRPRARALARWQPAQPSLQELRRSMGAEGASDDDLLLYFFTSRADVDTMRSARTPHSGADGSVERLMARLAQSRHVRQVHVQKGASSVVLQRA